MPYKQNIKENENESNWIKKEAGTMNIALNLFSQKRKRKKKENIHTYKYLQNRTTYFLISSNHFTVWVQVACNTTVCFR